MSTAYDAVNAAWPADTNAGRNLKPTAHEAKHAAVKLWNKFAAGERAQSEFAKWATNAGKLPKAKVCDVKITSGRNHTYWTGNKYHREKIKGYSVKVSRPFAVLQVNPDQLDGGWHELVHGLSHSIARAAYNARHNATHAFTEREMVEYVVSRGWHLGALAKPEKPKPDKAAVKLEQARIKLAFWQRKEKFAANKRKKYAAEVRRRERILNPTVAT